MSTQMLKFFQSNIGKEANEFAPPFTQWLKPTIRKVEMGSFEWEFTVRKEMTNPLKLLHGGVQAAILDDVIGATVAALDKPNPAVSLNLTIDFLGKAYEGEVILAKSNVIRQGKQVIYIQGEIVNSEGKLIAKATSNMLQITPKK